MGFLDRLERLVERMERCMGKQHEDNRQFWKKALGVEDTQPCSPSFEQLEALEFEQMETAVYKSWGSQCE